MLFLEIFFDTLFVFLINPKINLQILHQTTQHNIYNFHSVLKQFLAEKFHEKFINNYELKEYLMLKGDMNCKKCKTSKLKLQNCLNILSFISNFQIIHCPLDVKRLQSLWFQWSNIIEILHDIINIS